jgi:hypothetical protein
MVNSRLLHKVTKILQNHNGVMMEEKYDSAEQILIGLTFDYRQLENWQRIGSYSKRRKNLY